MCLAVEIQARFNTSETILDEILSNQISQNNKIGIGYESMNDKICDNDEGFVPKTQCVSQKNPDISIERDELRYDNT